MNDVILRMKEYAFRIKELVVVFVLGFILTFWLFADNVSMYKGTYLIDQNTTILILLIWPVMFMLMIVLQFLLEYNSNN